MYENLKIYVAGHGGMVGSAIVRKLKAKGYQKLIMRTSQELDLTRQVDVEHFIHQVQPDVIFIAAAKVGGILANKTYRAEFIYTNVMIQNNIIHSAWKSGVKRLIFFSSSCVYPRECPQPMKEEHLWTGHLEQTNKPYAVAKLAGMAMCEAYNEQYGTSYCSLIPTNLYGENDNYEPQQSHVVAALIQKFHSAKVADESCVTLWGTGTPRRELMYVDDAADAAIFLMEHYSGNEAFNVGLGEDISIRALAEMIGEIVGYRGEIKFDATKPDGAPRKLVDSGRIHALGWRASTPLREGLMMAYSFYKTNHNGMPIKRSPQNLRR